MKKRRMLLVLLAMACLLLAAESAGAENSERAYPYMVRKLEMVYENGQYEFWTLEQKAELDALAQSLQLKEENGRVHVLPAAEHLTVEQAREAAEAVLGQRFHVDADTLKHSEMLPEFLSEGGNPFWRIILQDSSVFTGETGSYIANIDAVTGEAGYCEILPYQSFWKFDGQAPLTLVPGDISTEKAVEIAYQTILENHLGARGLDERLLNLYTPYVGTFEDDELGRILYVEYNPNDGELFDYFGAYTVIIDPHTGIVWRSGRSNG